MKHHTPDHAEVGPPAALQLREVSRQGHASVGTGGVAVERDVLRAQRLASGTMTLPISQRSQWS